MKNIVCALSLISRIPIPQSGEMPPDIKKCAMHFPLAGYLAGALFASIALLLTPVCHNPIPARIIALACVYYFFNLFHFDGFMDSMDGLLSQKSRKRTLEIMRSGTSGPMAVAAGVFMLALKLYLVVTLPIAYTVLAFILARWSIVVAAAAGRPARSDGLGALLMPLSGRAVAGASLYLIPVLAAYRLPALLPACAVLLCTALLVRITTRAIGGLTGDTFGLINECNELTVLLVSTAWL